RILLQLTDDRVRAPRPLVMRSPLLLALAVAVGALAAALALWARAGRAGASCPPQPLSAAYVRRGGGARRATRGAWGAGVRRRPGGPASEPARAYRKPLLLVGRPAGRGGRLLTNSGVYYLAFGQPRGAGGGGPVALHVADGSQIVSDHTDGAKLSVDVGRDGQ